MSKQQQVEAFNIEHPVGSPVAVRRDSGEYLHTKVERPATVLSGHTPVVWVEGISGCFALSRVMAYAEPAPGLQVYDDESNQNFMQNSGGSKL